ncbi:RNA polymerase sigma factor [Prevotella scopos JCM 17725]|uniref:RNA polymerase sigma-70 factor, ECF subfamily n=1 Tax=Prevotella scopos JCM 17725 TaxID=1236518 RepID=A0AAX2F4T8_9BACT|nr:RNA polymerase sigma factor [Prevotella scopos]ANR72175.1 RNA polymerase subunit sigma-70 [Prevotella scopos JCM 17725]QUB45626.1 RNA polymerase sigma factor [Prevotella scopos JCM 17725]SHF89769.1 RNA polymerase sigma-70 factor, ECF subfamily [Prevotella scopos JCM 17725]
MQASDFKQLFLPCHRKLFSVAYRLMSNTQAAEDMVQETFLKLWMQRDKIERIDNPEAYSITVLRRLFYDRMRTEHLQEVDKDVGSLQVTSSQNISRQLEAADEYQRVRQLISHLPEPQGRIMLMRDVEDRSFEEISIETGLTEVNIRSILSRARKKIREQIKTMKYDKD